MFQTTNQLRLRNLPKASSQIPTNRSTAVLNPGLAAASTGSNGGWPPTTCGEAPRT